MTTLKGRAYTATQAATVAAVLIETEKEAKNLPPIDRIVYLADEAEFGGMTFDEAKFILQNGGYWSVFLTDLDYHQFGPVLDGIGGFVYENNPKYEIIDDEFEMKTQDDFIEIIKFVEGLDDPEEIEFTIVAQWMSDGELYQKQIRLPFNIQQVKTIGFHSGNILAEAKETAIDDVEKSEEKKYIQYIQSKGFECDKFPCCIQFQELGRTFCLTIEDFDKFLAKDQEKKAKKAAEAAKKLPSGRSRPTLKKK